MPAWNLPGSWSGCARHDQMLLRFALHEYWGVGCCFERDAWTSFRGGAETFQDAIRLFFWLNEDVGGRVSLTIEILPLWSYNLHPGINHSKSDLVLRFILQSWQKIPLCCHPAQVEQTKMRMENFQQTLAECGGDLVQISESYRSFGLQKVGSEWTYCEWMPYTQGVFLVGDFNGWDTSATPLSQEWKGGKWSFVESWVHLSGRTHLEPLHFIFKQSIV